MQKKLEKKTSPHDCPAQRSHNFYRSLRVSISTPALDVSADWGKFADASPAHSMALLRLSVGEFEPQEPKLNAKSYRKFFI